MDFDEAGSVCTVSGAEIEAACLASETPGLSENGFSFLADQFPIPFTRPMHSREKPALEGFCDVIVVIRLLRNPSCGGLTNCGCDQFQSVWLL